jgi:hypothetical protein
VRGGRAEPAVGKGVPWRQSHPRCQGVASEGSVEPRDRALSVSLSAAETMRPNSCSVPSDMPGWSFRYKGELPSLLPGAML